MTMRGSLIGRATFGTVGCCRRSSVAAVAIGPYPLAPQMNSTSMEIDAHRPRVSISVRLAGLLATLVLPMLLSLPGCSSSVDVGPAAIAGLTPDGTVDMEQVQVAYIGSGGGGTGTLYYRGGAYTFTIGGLGIGGIGASMMSGEGEVYKLSSLANFPGAYAQARYGFALGNKSAGDLWLQNDAGVIMHLKAERTGLMLSLGGDAVVISMSQ
jgi:hypothetical protein